MLRAPAGVYAVPGNHDWWFDAGRVRAALESVGIPVLDGRARRIEHGLCQFWLGGISDFREGAHDVDGTLAQVPHDETIVLFTHNPDVFPAVPVRVELTIAAHTRGGQVYFPGVGRPVVPSRYGRRYAVGLIDEEGRTLFVSPGIGTSILPVRFLEPPEVSVLVVKHADGGGLGLCFAKVFRVPLGALRERSRFAPSTTTES